MRDDRPLGNAGSPLDRAIDQVLREMAAGDPPEGLSATVRWQLARHAAEGETGRGAPPRRAAGRRWLVPVATAATVLLAAAVFWTLRPGVPPGAAPGEGQSGAIADAGRAAVARGTAAGTSLAGEPDTAGRPESTMAATATSPISADAAGGGVPAGPGRSSDAPARRADVPEFGGPDEWTDASRPAAAGMVGAAVALGELGDEEEFADPRFPRLAVRPLAPPAPPSFVPVQVHDVTISEIAIAPIEVRLLDPEPKPNPDKSPNREERR